MGGLTRTLLWRIAVILGVGAAGGVFGSLLAPPMGVVLGGLAATAGERRTARLLSQLER